MSGYRAIGVLNYGTVAGAIASQNFVGRGVNMRACVLEQPLLTLVACAHVC